MAWVVALIFDKEIFPGMIVKGENMNPMKGKHISSIPKLMEKMRIDVGSTYEHDDLFTKFEDHEDVSVLYNSVFFKHR